MLFTAEDTTCVMQLSQPFYTHIHTPTHIQKEREREKLYSKRGFIWVKAILSGGFVFHLIENVYSTSAKETRTQASLEVGPSHL